MRFASNTTAFLAIFACRILTMSPTIVTLVSASQAGTGTGASGVQVQGRGWFGKVFPEGKEDEIDMNLDMDIQSADGNEMDGNGGQGYDYGRGHGYGQGNAFLPPGGAQPGHGPGPFMSPPPPPPMDVEDEVESKSGDGQVQGQGQGQVPPPPPPPPMNQEENVNENVEVDMNVSTDTSSMEEIGGQMEQQQQQQQWAPPPPPGMWGMSPVGTPNDPNMNMNMMNPPPPVMQQHQYDEWSAQQQHQEQQQQQQYEQYGNQPYAEDWGQQQQQQDHLQAEIDALVSHQHSLYDQIQNLTSTLHDTELTADRQLSQIDKLLEQVADAEAYASAESNAALEYKANCTSLSDTITSLQHELNDWELKCKGLQDEQECDRDEIASLKLALKKKERELEKMACGIEMARLEEQRERYQQAQNERMMSQSNKGFFSWIFSLIWGDDISSSSSGEDESDDDLERLQEQAKSTLLSALQSERNNVDELEVALSAAQQNNTAIAEMVASRDSLIEELNDRVAVFEEDKVVLKAALRQLQKEMKEEAPKTQKLLTDLKAAKDVIKSLEVTIQSVEDKHSKEVVSLNSQLTEKNNQINETDSRLQMIGVYVDKLEERLASFAIAKRDISKREEICQDVESKASMTMEELEKLKKESADIESERDEMKKLVDLLVEERTLLQEEKNKIIKEKEKVDLECTSLRDELDLLNDSFLHLEAEVKLTKEQLEGAQASILQREKSLDELKETNDKSAAKLAEQEDMIQKSITVTMNLQQEVQNLEEEKERASSLILMLEEKVESIVEQQAAEAAAREAAEAAEREAAAREAAEAAEREAAEREAAVMDVVTAEREAAAEVGMEAIVATEEESVDSMEIFEDVPKEETNSKEEMDIEGLSEESPGCFDDEENSLSTDSEGNESIEPELSVVEQDEAGKALEEPPLPPPQLPLRPPQKLPSQPRKPRSVPFRGLRKAFSKATGIHGLFTPPSKKHIF